MFLYSNYIFEVVSLRALPININFTDYILNIPVVWRRKFSITSTTLSDHTNRYWLYFQSIAGYCVPLLGRTMLFRGANDSGCWHYDVLAVTWSKFWRRTLLAFMRLFCTLRWKAVSIKVTSTHGIPACNIRIISIQLLQNWKIGYFLIF